MSSAMVAVFSWLFSTAAATFCSPWCVEYGLATTTECPVSGVREPPLSWDADRDGQRDLVLFDYHGSFVARRGVEGFEVPFYLGDGPVVVADLDGDGSEELVLAEQDAALPETPAVVRLHVGLDDSVELLGAEHQLAAPSYIEAGQFTADERMDLLMLTGPDQLQAWVAEQSGDGSFTSIEPLDIPSLPWAADTAGVAALDADGDGDTDLAVGIRYGELRLYLQTEAGAFAEPVALATGVATSSIVMRPVDLDQDGSQEILTVEFGASGSEWFCQVASMQSDPIVLQDCHDALPSDVDGDGDLDLVTLSQRQGVIHVQWHELEGGVLQAGVADLGTAQTDPYYVTWSWLVDLGDSLPSAVFHLDWAEVFQPADGSISVVPTPACVQNEVEACVSWDVCVYDSGDTGHSTDDAGCGCDSVGLWQWGVIALIGLLPAVRRRRSPLH